MPHAPKFAHSVERESHEVQSFLDGIRPVILVESAWSNRLGGYKQVALVENQLLVFQHDVDVDLILKECVQDGAIIDWYRLALRTGHPPASSYACVHETYANEPRFVIDFCGMQFEAYNHTIHKDMEWLRNQIRIHQWTPTVPVMRVHAVLNEHVYPAHLVNIFAERSRWETAVRKAYREITTPKK